MPGVHISWVFGGVEESKGRSGGEGWGTEGSGGRSSNQISPGELRPCDLVSSQRLQSSQVEGELWEMQTPGLLRCSSILCVHYSLVSSSSPSFLILSIKANSKEENGTLLAGFVVQ